MLTNPDGSVLLTKEEFTELGKCYDKIHSELEDLTCLGDYIGHKLLVAIHKWGCLLLNKEFIYEDHFEPLIEYGDEDDEEGSGEYFPGEEPDDPDFIGTITDIAERINEIDGQGQTDAT